MAEAEQPRSEEAPRGAGLLVAEPEAPEQPRQSAQVQPGLAVRPQPRGAVVAELPDAVEEPPEPEALQRQEQAFPLAER